MVPGVELVAAEPGDRPVRAYHKLLVWDIMKKPLATRVAERALNPVIGKSFVAYATKPHTPAQGEA